MTQSEYKARQIRAKTNEVFEYDHNDEKPGKPLHILIPGGFIALATLALIIFIGYQTWFEENLAQNLGLTLIIILAPFYVGGVFLFSYGYELYNLPRALRLTAIIVFVTLASVVIIAVLFFALGIFAGSGLGSDFVLRVPENGLIARMILSAWRNYWSAVAGACIRRVDIGGPMST